MVRPAAAAADAADEIRCWRDDEHVIDADTQCVLAPYSKCRPSIDTICDPPDNFQRHLLLCLLLLRGIMFSACPSVCVCGAPADDGLAADF